MREIVVIAHDIRSTHNIGSLLRTAEGLGVSKVYFSGYSPYPTITNDERLPHLSRRIHNQIHKTALGAEETVDWERVDNLEQLLEGLRSTGFNIISLEQSPKSIPLPSFRPPEKCALIIGREVEGISQDLLNASDSIIEIPMYGKKESFNVVQAAAIALYVLRET